MNGLKRWFASTRMRNKILIGFGTVLVLMVVVALVVVVQTVRALELSEQSREATEALERTQALDLALSDRVAAFRDYLLSGDDAALTIYEEANGRFDEALAGLREALTEPGQLEQLDQAGRVADLWEEEVASPGIELREQTLQAALLPFDSVISFFQARGRTDALAASAEIEQLRLEQAALQEEARSARDDAIRQIRNATTIATIAAILVSLLVATWLSGLIARALRDAVEFGGVVAAGDFTQHLPVESDDELGELIGTLNRMAADLRRTIAGVTGATTQVAASAEQIASASEEISYTADQQVRSTEETSSSMEEIAAQIARVSRSTESLAASVEQTSSSITEMSNSIEQTATSTETLGASVEQTSATIEEMAVSIAQVGRHVDETSQIAKAAEGDARSGGDAVERSSEGMRRIHTEMDELTRTVKQLSSASASIGRISEVIESIADQTNLLALNASIEAARAGEHGRGFSVVAQEIRRLAERSVESTREIGTTVRQVIQDMDEVARRSTGVAERTNEGIKLATSAGTALEKIISTSGRTRQLMDEVTQATRQQIGAAEQAQEAIRHIQNVTHEVRIATREQATGSRQIAHAVENMSRQTREVFAATGEQKKGGELVLQATEHINQSARATQEAIKEMTQAAQDLSAQANRLSQLIASFRV
jgi:methyl-accepting chemotaxis protein